MKAGKTYRIKYLGRWINAKCEENKHVKELFFRTKSKEITTAVINEIKPTVKKSPTKKTLFGFSCPLHSDTIIEVYYFMAEEYIRGDLSDFQAIFSNESNAVKNPIKWLILNQRGTNFGRGNQTALFIFLQMMLKKVSNQDLIKSKDLFIDEKGKFIEDRLVRPDKAKVKTFGFENHFCQKWNCRKSL